MCEMLMNLIEGVDKIMEFIPLTPHDEVLKNTIETYVKIAMFAGISIVYYLDMIYLTVDKFLEIMLNIKYPLYRNKTKAKYLLLLTWLLALAIALTLAIVSTNTSYDWEEHIFKYCFPILNFLFLHLKMLEHLMLI